MFENKDIRQMQDKGIDPALIEQQISNFKTGFPFMNLVSPATPGHGILQIGDEEIQRHFREYPEKVKGREVLKFVPASGAASRMFKALFEFREQLENGTSADALLRDTSFNSPAYFFNHLSSFAFYEELASVMASNGLDLQHCLKNYDFIQVLDYFLGSKGLNYANLPKGLLKFHRYASEPHRTAVEEHLVEAANYARDDRNISRVHFTVSPEHMQGFISLINEVSATFEQRFNLKYEIDFSIQKPSTDTIAVDEHNQPFREKDGSLLFRPGGHGALIQNLNDLKADIVFIKNIDNVVPDRLKEPTHVYKRILGSLLIELQKEVFQLLVTLENNQLSDRRVEEIAAFCNEVLHIRYTSDFKQLDRNEKIRLLKKKLNRPIRVCGMVKNEGEPGGGPFWVRAANGEISLQIVESSQINMKDEEQKRIFSESTHFNPVDLVCGLKDYQGNHFNLPDFVDPLTGFISEKSKDGKTLKAQELPGLWNGAMADWITIFVEVPVITFNPVKVINDLLRPEHLEQ